MIRIGVAAVLGMLLQGISFSESTGQDISDCQRAEAILGDLIVHHPRKEIHEELLGWINSGQVRIFCNFNEVAMAATAMRLEDGRPIEIFFAMNPHFIIESHVRSPVKQEYYDRRYKETIVYHEYIHLKEHFTGVSRLDKPAAKDIQARAKHIWETEYRAIKAQWELANELQVPFLLPAIHQETKMNPGEKGFLEGFYRMMKQRNEPDLEKLLPYWEKLYLEEKEKP